MNERTVRILLVHNFYREPGGEDRVFATEAQLLKDRGHQVITYARRTPEGHGVSLLRLAGQAFWNQHAYREVRSLIRETRPDVVHLHNTFPLISPAACYAARREGVATVQTLHNYRLLCANGLLFRAGRPCESCVGRRVAWPGVVHACYRGSRASSLAAAATVAAHGAAGTWARAIDRYIALTNFARQKFIEGGLPAERIAVKPNVVHPDPGSGDGAGRYALFVGRLSPEKGVKTLLEAWRRVGDRLPLTIAGDGPLAPRVQEAAASNRAVTWVGHASREQVYDLLAGALCLIVPSVWYETFGLVVAEAFAKGTPVVAARLGALAELVDQGRTGRQFQPGDADDLAHQVLAMLDSPDETALMRAQARTEYEARYSSDSNYARLLSIYDEALARRERRSQHERDPRR